MTLGFSQEIKGVKNFFVEKIWSGLLSIDYDLYSDYLHPDGLPNIMKHPSHYLEFKPKLHTIRAGNRWRAGMDIHMVINNRTVNRFQFAPTIKCKSVQKIVIEYDSKGFVMVYVDGFNRYDQFLAERKNSLVGNAMNEFMCNLAINDGFDSVDAFFEYFNKDFSGQLIHWTDLKY